MSLEITLPFRVRVKELLLVIPPLPVPSIQMLRMLAAGTLAGIRVGDSRLMLVLVVLTMAEHPGPRAGTARV